METISILLALGTVYAVFSIAVELYNAYNFHKEHKVFRINRKIYLYLLIIALSAGFDFFAMDTLEHFTKGVLGGLGFSALFGIVLLLISLISNLFFKLNIGTKKIVVAGKSGLTIHKGNKSKEYLWASLDDAFFNKNKDEITFIGREKLIVKKSDCSNWALFLSDFPRNFKSLDYTYIDSLFSDLQTCRMCGMKAYNGEECYYCGTVKWSEELGNDYGTDENYIRELQLDFFATMDESEQFDDFKLKDNFFKQDPNWKPLVTKEEVLEYSRKEYWGEN